MSPHVIYGVEYVLTHMKKYVSTWKQKIECLYPWLVITSKYHFWFASNVKVWWFHFQWTILGFNRYSPFHHICKTFVKRCHCNQSCVAFQPLGNWKTPITKVLENGLHKSFWKFTYHVMNKMRMINKTQVKVDTLRERAWFLVPSQSTYWHPSTFLLLYEDCNQIVPIYTSPTLNSIHSQNIPKLGTWMVVSHI